MIASSGLAFVFVSAMGISVALQDAEAVDTTVYRWVFGGDADLTKGSRRLGELLNDNLALLDGVCQLSSDQKLRLELVGRGENKRLLEHIAEIDRRYQAVKDDSALIIPLQNEAWKINQSLEPGIANADSRFMKALEKALTEDQLTRAAPVLAVIRAGGRVRGRTGADLEFFLNNTAFTDDGMAVLEKMSNLRTLEIVGTRVTDAGLAHLRETTGLGLLLATDLKITDSGIAHLARLTDLYFLGLDGTALSDAGLSHLKELPRLQWLRLNNTQVGDAGLSHLIGLKMLRNLELASTRITNAGLAHLKELKSLRSLELGNTQISDSGLAELEDLSNLNHLSLYKTGITDVGLQHLGALKELEYLSLAGTQVSDSGILHLHGLTNLKILSVGGTMVSKNGLSKLKESIPTVYVRK